MHAYIYIYIYTHTYIHTYMHTYIHTYIHILCKHYFYTLLLYITLRFRVRTAAAAARGQVRRSLQALITRLHYTNTILMLYYTILLHYTILILYNLLYNILILILYCATGPAWLAAAAAARGQRSCCPVSGAVLPAPRPGVSLGCLCLKLHTQLFFVVSSVFIYKL